MLTASSHIVANVNEFVERGIIPEGAKEPVLQLINSAIQDSVWATEARLSNKD